MRDDPNFKLFDAILAGGFAGFFADTAMHSLDTVKTRMQGQLTSSSYNRISPKYDTLPQSYLRILRDEGIRGLYGGYISASIGSLLSTAIHFGVYEKVKRELIRVGANPELSYFCAGALGDVFAAGAYVPSEVLKTRLQLQGVYNNPNSLSSHNYLDTTHALKSVYKQRGAKGMYKGFGATLVRDVPYTAIQFLLYETFKTQSEKRFTKVTSVHEMTSGAMAGIIAGGLTTPLDVIKTYLQTQKPLKAPFVDKNSKVTKLPSHRPVYYAGIVSAAKGIYDTSGVRGLFSGAAPRMIWTGSQSMIMFLLYEQCMKWISHQSIQF